MKKNLILKALTIFFVTAFLEYSLAEKTQTAETKVTGSIALHNESQNSYPIMAKISFAQAMQAAKNLVPGSVLAVALENEDGYLVYSVEIKSIVNTRHEVIIDAGTSRVLSDSILKP